MTLKYTELGPKSQAVVDSVMSQFSDMFDNDEFGPFIQDFTDFGKDRYAGFMDMALGDVMMYVTIPGIRWSVESFPYVMPIARRCMELALTIEVIRHFMRSYVEIPDTGRVGAPDVVRRDYLSRWQGLLNDYQNQLKDAGKRLTAELYNAQAAHNSKVLVDLPSMRGVINMDQPAERPQMGWWW